MNQRTITVVITAAILAMAGTVIASALMVENSSSDVQSEQNGFGAYYNVGEAALREKYDNNMLLGVSPDDIIDGRIVDPYIFGSIVVKHFDELSPTHPDLTNAYGGLIDAFGSINKEYFDVLSPTHPDLTNAYGGLIDAFGIESFDFGDRITIEPWRSDDITSTWYLPMFGCSDWH